MGRKPIHRLRPKRARGGPTAPLNRGFDFYYDHFDFNRLQESNLDEMERPGNVVADIHAGAERSYVQ